MSLLPVYLIHWNAPRWCASAARSILASRDVDVRLAVVDNGQDEGPPLASCLPERARILTTGANRGYTGGANAALDDWRAQYPDCPFAVLGSHDLHVEPETLAQLRDRMEQLPDCGILAPAVVEPKAVSGGIACGGRWVQLPLEGAPELAEREWANGTCLLLRRACVDAVGRFDERLGSYAEDVDYGLRARDLGWRVLVLTTARARGLGTASSRASDDKVVNTVLLTAKRTGARGVGAWAARLVVRGAFDGMASVMPWRAREARSEAAARARQNGRVLSRLAREGRLVSMLRSPGT